MKRLVTISLFLLFASANSRAIDNHPDYTMLWNGFTAVRTVDSCAIAISTTGVVSLRPSESPGVFEQADHLFLPDRPKHVKRHGDVAAVATVSGALFFVGLTNLPDLELLGTIYPAVAFRDFDWQDDNLYLAREFDGVRVYSMIGYHAAELVDSDIVGVHVVQVQAEPGLLYALDDYNGLLQYSIAGDGLLTHKTTLNAYDVPLAFCASGDHAVVSLENSEVLLADFSAPAQPVVTSFAALVPSDKLLLSDSLLVALSSDYPFIQLFDKAAGELTVHQLDPVAGIIPDGDWSGSAGDSELLLPSTLDGLVRFPLHLPPPAAVPSPAYDRPGPVTGIKMHGGRLFTGGPGNPLDVYRLDPDGAPDQEPALLSGVSGVLALDVCDSLLAAIYEPFGGLAVFAPEADSFAVKNIVTLPIGEIGSIHCHYRTADDTLKSVLVVSGRRVDVLDISETYVVALAERFELPDTVAALAVDDSLLAISTAHGEVWFYAWLGGYDFQYLGTAAVGFEPAQLAIAPGQMVAATTDQATLFALVGAQMPQEMARVSLSLPASDLAIDGNRLYTAGERGIAVYELSAADLRLIDRGGPGASSIEAAAGIAAVSDGASVGVYDLRGATTDIIDPRPDLPVASTLQQNYPNPFNPTTSISFTLEQSADVSLTIYNILGQQVRRLADGYRSAGEYRVFWDGRGDSGEPVAGGVYFYRLRAGDNVMTKKMVLIK